MSEETGMAITFMASYLLVLIFLIIGNSHNRK